MTDERSWTVGKSKQKIAMDETLVEKNAMDEKLVEKNAMDEKLMRNRVMDAELDVIDLSIFKICGWNEVQPVDQKSLEKFIEEKMPQLSV